MNASIYPDQVCLQDCVAGMATLPDASAQLIIADPPYNIGKDFGNNKDNLPLAEYISWSKSWLNEALRLLAPGGSIFIYGFPEILAHISVLFPLERQRWLQWHYTNKNIPGLNFWQRSHESILCLWKDKPHFNRDAVRESYTQSFLAGSAGRVRPGSQCRFSKTGKTATRYNAHENGALPRDVICISALAGGAALKERNIYCKTCQLLVAPNCRGEHLEHDTIMHPTQKPLGLTRRLVMSCKPAGSFNALIPFAGSGSECKCVLELDGHFAAFEINPDYVTLANAVLNTLPENDMPCII